MYYFTKSSSEYRLINDEVTTHLVYVRNEVEPDLTPPLEVTITTDATIFYSEDEYFIDEENAVQSKSYQTAPSGGIKAILNRDQDGPWFLEIDGKRVDIRLEHLDFHHEYDWQTGFKLEGDTISYYDRPLKNVDVKTFRVLNCNYSLDKNHVYCGDRPISEADVETFEAWNHGLARDKNHVYHFSKALLDMNPAHLQLIGNSPETSYFRDDKQVMNGENVVLEADLESFRELDHPFAIDKNHVYRFGQRLENVDVKTFEIISDDHFKDKDFVYWNGSDGKAICPNDGSFEELGHGYFKTNGGVYYFYENQKISEDSKGFTMLENGWAKDSSGLFFQGEKMFTGKVDEISILNQAYAIINGRAFYRFEEMEGVDTANFEVWDFEFAHDKQRLYYMGEAIENSFPASFEQLDEYIFKDERNVYIVDRHYGHLLHAPNLDGASVELIERYYFKTKDAVYFYEAQIPEAEPATFEILEGAYSKDKNAVYYSNQKLEGLDPKTTRALSYQFICDEEHAFHYDTQIDLVGKDCQLIEENGDYIKDKKRVFYEGELVPDADPATFEILEGNFQRDKDHLFYGPQKLDIDPKTAIHIGEPYIIGQSKVYFNHTTIEGADVNSFEILDYGFAKDKNHVYWYRKPQEGIDPASFEVKGYSYSQDKDNIYTIENGELVIERKREVRDSEDDSQH